MIEDKLLYLSVRIEENVGEENNQILGSGVWWEPSEDSKYMYIFTAAHVVKDKKKLVVRYRDKDDNERTINIDDREIVCHTEPKFDGDKLPYNDVAVLRCKRTDTKGVFKCIYKIHSVESLNDNKKMIFRGFPNSLYQKSSFILSNKPAFITFENYEKQEKRFTYRLDLSLGVKPSESNEQLVGFSGCGIFLKNDSQLLLLGIHSNSMGEDVALNTCCGMNSELLVEICKDTNWDIPMITSSVTGNLEDAMENFYDQINNDKLYNIMEEIINIDFRSTIESNFCGTSKICKNNSCPHQCTTFRNYLLIIFCILKYLNNSINFEKPSIVNEGRDIPVRYVCCDGESKLNTVTLSSFIRSLKNDYLMKEKVDEQTLILWGTNKPLKKSAETFCGPKRFKNIIIDIKKSDILEGKFDIKSGLNQPKELSVIEINELIDNIDQDTLDDMVNIIKLSLKN
ncbi:hypothetical protein [Clostridium tyrobutyricum]|uniref:hypothetical protein n=1 Tax=Clostridium tyrobutyricum TaxID=1519 RepID=UPI001C3C29BD|nr:hypothetical protein [Clostridium tyrobutyricum]MBV4438456.1 hypothetical protein [Clostridium tyrobutyricum]